MISLLATGCGPDYEAGEVRASKSEGIMPDSTSVSMS